jgi:hypothetical protein
MVTALPPVYQRYQDFVLYETKQTFYLVAATTDEKRYRILEIDRKEPRELVWKDAGGVFDSSSVREYLGRVAVEHGIQKRTGLHEVATAFGVVGFVHFMEGHYIILVTKRKCVAQLGSHLIYKIDSTNMFYIPHSTVRIVHPEEFKYLKLFQSMDLSSNFYFSYTYDLTNSLQCQIRRYPGAPPRWCSKFLWNLHFFRKFLIPQQQQQLVEDFFLRIIHGYVGQFNVPVFGRDIYLTLIARRSSRYAGTRFQKRGTNDEGDVANEVETEQIVHNAMTTAHDSGEFTSYVQHRGSVPAYWSQDNSSMQPKPLITIDLGNPYSEPAAKHFRSLLQRYGSPIIILNLVKKREKKPRESLLTKELKATVKYLNQFLPPEHHITYIHKDMARINKRNGNLIEILEDIAEHVVKKTGFFHSGQELYCHKLNPHHSYNRSGGMGYQEDFIGRSQTGVLRVNCVDCLDRTNTAQFILGKVVLGHQLYALGVVDSPLLPFESDCLRLLEEVYETHGDVQALQYGGSHLVHRIRSYRRVASPVTSHAGDVYQSIQRYYANFFTDAEKQMAINLFLGMYTPREGQTHLWDLPSDYYLHHKLCSTMANNDTFYHHTKWWSEKLFQALPLPYLEVAENDGEEEDLPVFIESGKPKKPDSFYELYLPFKLTEMEDLFSTRIERTDVSYKPADADNPSPFVPRVPFATSSSLKKSKSAIRSAPVGSPQPVGIADSSSSAGISSDDDDWSDLNEKSSSSDLRLKTPPPWYHLPPCEDVYKFSLTQPTGSDLALYKQYSLVYQQSCTSREENLFTLAKCQQEQAMWVPGVHVCSDSSISVSPPTVSPQSMQVYEDSIHSVQQQQLIR